ncbi:hypothetical protein E2C01_046816 [Portunus trituberculatus]|uniref:Uncharacterized protein n=1 Tax=Portunus trituberculatus TaxID=210409 RepID=A0A5B7G623_PORTR|nr:hypothetical protein [Portunus trituberculatus]
MDAQSGSPYHCVAPLTMIGKRWAIGRAAVTPYTCTLPFSLLKSAMLRCQCVKFCVLQSKPHQTPRLLLKRRGCCTAQLARHELEFVAFKKSMHEPSPPEVTGVLSRCLTCEPWRQFH